MARTKIEEEGRTSKNLLCGHWGNRRARGKLNEDPRDLRKEKVRPVQKSIKVDLVAKKEPWGFDERNRPQNMQKLCRSSSSDYL